jgi:hypothetical protein
MKGRNYVRNPNVILEGDQSKRVYAGYRGTHQHSCSNHQYSPNLGTQLFLRFFIQF